MIAARGPASTPEDAERLFAEHAEQGDLDALLALYEPQASRVQRDGSVASGTAALRAGREDLATRRPRVTTRVTRTIHAGGDLAVLYVDWTIETKGPDGAPTSRSGQGLDVLRRQPDGAWLFVVDEAFTRG